MLSVTRKQKIKDIILEKKSATVSELSKLFSVTDETIRRDLKALESEGIMRTYGGAFLQTGVENQVNTDIRADVYIDNKTKIARKCREFINNGDAIFLDNSTTSLYIARAIADMRVTLVTNSLRIVEELKDHDNIRLVMIGGFFSGSESAFYGFIAQRTLGEYFLDKSFISCRSLSIENGVTDSIDHWAQVRQAAIEHSQEVYIAADFSKFDKNSFMHICGYESINAIITDKPLAEKWHKSMEKYNCRLIDDIE